MGWLSSNFDRKPSFFEKWIFDKFLIALFSCLCVLLFEYRGVGLRNFSRKNCAWHQQGINILHCDIWYRECTPKGWVLCWKKMVPAKTITGFAHRFFYIPHQTGICYFNKGHQQPRSTSCFIIYPLFFLLHQKPTNKLKGKIF